MTYLELHLVFLYRPGEQHLVLLPVQGRAVVPAPDGVDGAPGRDVVQEVQSPEVGREGVDIDAGEAGGEEKGED